jgi:hypothetical protein
VKRIVVVLLVILAWQGVCQGATTLEGYSEFFGELSGESRQWRFGNPQFLGEFRVKSTPWLNTEAFLKMQGLSNKWDNERWENFFFMKEGHLRYRGQRIETHIFSGQDRFWLNEPLLNIVSNDIIKDDDYGPKAQGIRVDVWDTYGVAGTAFYSDKATPYRAVTDTTLPSGAPYALPPNAVDSENYISTDDYRGGRVKRSFLADRMLLGSTYARKDYGSGEREYDEVYAFDCELALGNFIGTLSPLGRVTLVAEGGQNISGWLEDKEAYGWKVEVRDVKYGPLSFIGSLSDYDENFYTLGLARGDIWDDNDYHGHYLQADFRVPRKEINLKGWRYRYKPHHLTTNKQPFEETGGEIYVRFQRGFTGKVEYKKHINKDGTWPGLFMEIAGENKLVRIRAQYRIRDINTDYEVTAYGFDANANLTDHWKFYARLLTVDEKTEARETVFAQIQYTGWNSAEFFLEFGDSGASWDLARSDGFVDHNSSAVTVRVFKAFLRLYY